MPSRTASPRTHTPWATLKTALAASAVALLIISVLAPAAHAQLIARAPTVTPDGSTVSAPESATGWALTFWVTNNSDYEEYLTLSCTPSGAVTSCDTPTSLYFAAGQTQIVTVAYTTGAPGTGSVFLFVFGNGGDDTGMYNVNVTARSYRVGVTPDTQAVAPPAYSSANQAFTVSNLGNGDATYNVAVTCAPPAASNCSVPAPIYLAAGASAVVTVSFQTGAQGSQGTVRLRASYSGNSAVQDDGSVRLTVGTGTQAPIVDVASVNPGTTVDRDLCLAAATGPATAYQCGGLRIIHALPTTRTLNAARRPVLLYSSQAAHPAPVIAAIVTLPNDGNIPQSVTAQLVVNGVQRATGSWTGSNWAGGSARRIAVSFDGLNDSTGVYAYWMKITRQYASSAQIDSVPGELIIVNRKNSYFGAGWWVSGLEKLIFPGGGRVLWIGGDGSTRLYQQVASNVWTAPSLDRPDTLKFDTPTLSYVRYLPNGLKVKLDQSGNHVSTIDRRGKTTYFSYTGSSPNYRLHGIAVAGWPSGDTYKFNVNGTTDRVDSVQSPAPGGTGTTERVTRFSFNAGRIMSIRDPSGDSVTFGYTYVDSGSMYLIGTRTDRRQTVARFNYGPAWSLIRATLELDGGNTISNAFQPQETKGIAGQSATATVDAYTFIDGPRPDADVPDYTRIWADRFGAPTKIQNALGHETILTRGDGRFPALVTEMKGPNGFVTWAMYDVRGNVEATCQVRPYGDAQQATTTYVWDQKWDFAKRVTLPQGEVTTVEYDSINGNRFWDEDGRGSLSRISYDYYSSGTEKDLLRAVVRPGGARDSVAYDALGNVRTSRTPLGNETRVERDAVGRTVVVRSQINPGNYLLWQDDSTTYDSMDRVTRQVSYGPGVPNATTAQRLILRNEYDGEGNLMLAERSINPDPYAPPIGLITTRWIYDRAGRKIQETASDGQNDSLAYDPTGNLTAWFTRRRDASGNRYVIQMVYDTLNRLKQRIVPQVDYPARSQGIATLVGLTGLGIQPYGNLSIPANTTRFWYNSLGLIDSATNAYATIRRRYNPSGLLRNDSLFIRWYDQSSNMHGYGLTYNYDLNGRRSELVHPNQLAPRQGGAVFDRTTYSYDSLTGWLATVTDPLGQRFAFQYNAKRELQSLTYPWDAIGAPTEAYTYDAESRLSAHLVYNPSGDLRSTTYQYDARDKIVTAGNTKMMKDSLSAAYSGLGHLIYSKYKASGVDQINRSVVQTVEGSATYDALGNSNSGTDVGTITSSGWGTDQAYTASQWLSAFAAGTGRQTSKYITNRSDSYVYDAAGNVEFKYTASQVRNNGPVPSADDRASFYAADGQLWAADYRWVQGTVDPSAEGARWRRVVEYYRYDPLGRRILVRTLRTCDPMLEGDCRMSTIRRTIWDGDRELYEIQMPGDSTESATWVENDTTYVNDRIDSSPLYFDRNPYFGRVAYTYGPAIDQPLGIIRMQYANHPYSKTFQQWGRFTVYPHWSARGEADLGSINSGLWNYCLSFSDGQRCLNPWWYKGTYAFQREAGGQTSWLGTLVTSKEDGTHTLFRRNRSYDPHSGRFTQEDPIGLAGGLNTYGFAAGDPVNYSDPLGLKVCGRTASLRGGIEAAANASIVWDRDGCVSSLDKVTFRGGQDWASVQRTFAGMVTSDAVWSVAPGRADKLSPFGCRQYCSWFDPDTRTAYIFDIDYGKHGATYERCGFLGIFRDGRYDLGGLVAHELLGHGALSGTFFNTHRSSRLWVPENVYNRANNRPTACPSP